MRHPLDSLQRYFDADGCALLADATAYRARFAGFDLHSHFQPLISARTLRPQACEALLRARPVDSGGPFIPPAVALAAAATPAEAVLLDRLCRVLHALNFARQAHDDLDLYLNVSGRHLLGVSHGYGRTFEEMLKLCGLSPRQVVLEILESSVDDLPRLQQAVATYKQRGFRIAIDDFGARHSNFDRLWHISPDVVKLDRGLIEQATCNPRAALILPRLIGMLQELGAWVVCEGIETERQHALCVAAGADLLQGYFYARPAAQLAPATASPLATFA